MTAAQMHGRMPLSRGAWVVSWGAQLTMAAILAQTLFFKFTYAPETRYIFAKLGGRPAATVAALVELACVVLLLHPRTPAFGAVLALGTMAGAIVTHLLLVGIVIPDPGSGRGDGGLLFGLALAVAALGLVVLALRRADIAALLGRFPRR